MYLDDLAQKIREHIPQGRMPDGDAQELFRLYAVLLRAKGSSVTNSDIHDAWSLWMATRDDKHASLIPYEDLAKDVREEDAVFTVAVREVADRLGRSGGSRPAFAEVLF